jgi:hypothetical protein
VLVIVHVYLEFDSFFNSISIENEQTCRCVRSTAEGPISKSHKSGLAFDSIIFKISLIWLFRDSMIIEKAVVIFR